VSRTNPTPILPRGHGEERPLFVIMAIMSFLAALSLILVLMGLRQSASWQNDLISAATVQIVGENIAADTNKAADILRTFPGINSVDILPKSEGRALLSPWIGELELPEDIIVPSLIRLNVDDNRFESDAANEALRAAGIAATIDNHRQWSKNLSTTWTRIRLALLFLLGTILCATIAISTFATRSVMLVRRNIIQVLGQVGATDKFIGGLFVKRFLSLGLKAAITGIIAALLFLGAFMLWQNMGTDETGLKIAIEFSDILWLIGLAIVMGAISALTAGAAARRSIQRQ